ncbi:hypothetical protein TrRE_jg5579 [Triparma retinervis]|uniref:Uncharacterized protein n=1 Tax=Triparma retinervis TaxID=2557542 RepID=A0A9W6ZHF2_9STRA|nr:hypothetical protein TrRE_jg5579 [Triparma retinervis]
MLENFKHTVKHTRLQKYTKNTLNSIPDHLFPHAHRISMTKMIPTSLLILVYLIILLQFHTVQPMTSPTSTFTSSGGSFPGLGRPVQRRRRVPLPFVPKPKPRYPHPLTGDLISIPEYIEALEGLLKESQGQIKTLTGKVFSFRRRISGIARSSTPSSKVKGYLDKITELEGEIKVLLVKLGDSETGRARELKDAIEKNEVVVRELKDNVMRMFKEELDSVREEMEEAAEERVRSERRVLEGQLERLRRDKEREIQALAKAKDEVIARERGKVVKVLGALQDAEVKKRELEGAQRRDRKRERGGGGAGKSAEGGGKKVVGVRY